MQFPIRRFHILILIVLAFLLTGAWIYKPLFSSDVGIRAQTIVAPSAPTLREALPLPVKKVPLSPFPAKTIAFTFDDGPHPVFTERLLGILKRHHIRATFFVVGKQIEKHPELLRLILQEGHEIANHTYSHRDMRTLSSLEICEELERTELLVRPATNQKMRFFRPPGGRYNDKVVAEARESGYEMVLWNIFPQDHANPKPGLIQSRVLKSAQDHGIVLFHSGVENTLETLPTLIGALKKRGYSFQTVSELRNPHSSLTDLAKSKP